VTWPKTETELAEPVVAWLEDLGWEVFQEVEAHSGGPRADLVARRGPVIWAIEVKRSLSLKLLGQGHAWKQWAHRVSIAFPAGKRSASAPALRLAKLDGLGLIEVYRPTGHGNVWERERGEFRRRIVRPPRLTEAHKTYAKAGNADGRRWSPFKATCENIRDVVAKTPGLTITEVVERVEHHYASPKSARGSLLTWARAGKLDGVVARGGSKAEGAWRLYPEDWQGPVPPRAPRSRSVPEASARRAAEQTIMWSGGRSG